MLKLQFVTLFLVLILAWSICTAQTEVLYKQIDTTQLFLEIYHPDKMDSAEKYPAMVFFFGGGWKKGNRTHFLNHAKYFSKRGLVCFLVDYRTRDKNQTTPFESLKDAKSAIRFIRKNASDFNIDANKILASGGSAGGHLAAATALIEEYNEDSDDLSVSCVPKALVLFNPVIDNGPGGYGFERIGSEYKNFSPLHNLKKGTPATIIFLGTNDNLIPVETAEYYKTVMEKVGSRCDLKLYEGEGHGFFNYNKFDNYKKTVFAADQFLQSLGYLDEAPAVKIE
jgi:acetyl esterase/lipase